MEDSMTATGEMIRHMSCEERFAWWLAFVGCDRGKHDPDKRFCNLIHEWSKLPWTERGKP